ncbi:YhcN/YlaJ family sporulation lipoprotein [Bacillus aerolatus]|uniref:YhcN/YlaJ family sporulation lipoprotein n=1 Tax=Bacillus aerolatus TaxID=2653354 RepID=A0A6I1FLR8_9BACI|nr:YhcN/YlaJ family sporulation lipoprotein [Bacillus aerolatus]KAB7707929.1 YhcN/YlaJ family sporulation lipoprotein [Bacillus aerolatus]
MKIFLPFLLIALLFGCAQKEEMGFNTEEHTVDQTPYKKVRVNNSEPNETKRISIREASRRLAGTAREMPGVNDATAVAWGRYAFVGIDVNDNLDRSEVGSIKYTVAEGLKNQPYGADAVVIADPDLYARLKEIGQDIENGRPLQGLANELADIAGRAMPEVPGDLTEHETDKPTEKPKKQLSPTEDQQLQRQQEEQSNHHK